MKNVFGNKLSLLIVLLSLSFLSVGQQPRPQFSIVVYNKNMIQLEDAEVALREYGSDKWINLKYDSLCCYSLQTLDFDDCEVKITHPDYASQTNRFIVNQRPFGYIARMGKDGDRYLQMSFEKHPYTPHPELIGVMPGLANDTLRTREFNKLIERLGLEREVPEGNPYGFVRPYPSYEDQGGIILRKKDGSVFDQVDDLQCAALRSAYGAVGPIIDLSSPSFNLLTNRIRAEVKGNTNQKELDQLVDYHSLRYVGNTKGARSPLNVVLKARDGIGDDINRIVEELMLSGLFKYAEVEHVWIKLLDNRE